MHAALSVLRGLVFLKRHAGPVLHTAALPFLAIGRFFLFAFGVPLFRVYFLLHRASSHVLGMAKTRLGFIATNSRLIHIAMVGMSVVVVTMNISARGVRAESFGRQSILYHLVSVDNSSDVETEIATPVRIPAASSYAFDPSVKADEHQDFTSFESEYATTVTGGSVISLPGSGQKPSRGSSPVPVRANIETYQVAEGDTLGGIADTFGLHLTTLLWANNLTARSTIRSGQSLSILPVDGVVYKVKKGDTVAKIAKTYGAEAQAVLAINQLSEGAVLSVGTSLIVPGGEPPSAPPPVTRPSSIAGLFVAPTSSITKAIFAPKPDDTSTTSRGSASGKGTWSWPTDWRVITQYFSWKHTGVDIDGDFTTHSYAAADGVVVYSGWRTGYGMTVEVDHGDGLITRYAHHSKLYAKTGDVVKAGDLLAQTGTTGFSTGTHLHFEVIKDGKFQNPLEYIR